MEEVIRLHFLLQSVLHKIEDLDGSLMFKRELKQRSNAYYKHIEKIVEGVTVNMNTTESESHIKIVNEIDNIVNGIQVLK